MVRPPRMKRTSDSCGVPPARFLMPLAGAFPSAGVILEVGVRKQPEPNVPPNVGPVRPFWGGPLAPSALLRHRLRAPQPIRHFLPPFSRRPDKRRSRTAPCVRCLIRSGPRTGRVTLFLLGRPSPPVSGGPQPVSGKLLARRLLRVLGTVGFRACRAYANRCAVGALRPVKGALYPAGTRWREPGGGNLVAGTRWSASRTRKRLRPEVHPKGGRGPP